MKIVYGFFALLLLPNFSVLAAPNPSEDFWTSGPYHQDYVRTPEAAELSLSAFINQEWRKYKIVSFTPEFLKWNKEKRLQAINDVLQKKVQLYDTTREPQLAGPHNGIVASVGFTREDTLFSLNNAVKGMGFLPKREKLKEILKIIADHKNSPINEKLEILKSFYTNLETTFDLNKQVSLELYSEPKFVTETFLNQAVNPVSTIVFLDFPSYKLKTIVRLLDPNDPTLTDYERDVAKYANDIHSFFHGEFTKNFIAVIYYVVEIFDNSPGKAKGKKIVPEWP